MSLQYTTQIFDRNTGELVNLDLGLYMTLTEFTDLMGVPMKLGREVLNEIGLLALEGGRFRLKEEHARAALGRRLKTKSSKFPFDALSPSGQSHARARWDAALKSVLERRSRDPDVEGAEKALKEFREQRLGPLTTQMEVYWLLHHFPKLSTRSIARILHVTDAIVFKWSALRQRQVKQAHQKKMMELA